VAPVQIHCPRRGHVPSRLSFFWTEGVLSPSKKSKKKNISSIGGDSQKKSIGGDIFKYNKSG
jgi:hypothetical protein